MNLLSRLQISIMSFKLLSYSITNFTNHDGFTSKTTINPIKKKWRSGKLILYVTTKM